MSRGPKPKHQEVESEDSDATIASEDEFDLRCNFDGGEDLDGEIIDDDQEIAISETAEIGRNGPSDDWCDMEIEELTDSSSINLRTRSIESTAMDTVPARPGRLGIHGSTNVAFEQWESPLNYFLLFWSEHVLNTFLLESNNFAIASKTRDWKMLTIAELKVFFGIIIHLGIIKYPNMEYVWDPDRGSQWVRNRMSFFRFKKILSCWHWMNTAVVAKEERKVKNKEDPFWVVSSLLTYLDRQFGEHFVCGQKLCIDESCFDFKGRHKARCYNPNKPSKWHFKAFCLNDSGTGYLHSFRMYRGKEERRPADIAATEWPVFELTENERYHNKGHLLATDNWYTSVAVAKHLASKGIDFVGTIKANKKGLPRHCIFAKSGPNKKQRGIMKAATRQITLTNGKMLPLRFYGWMDNKPVHMLTTLPGFRAAVNRVWKEDGVYQGRKSVPIPTPIVVYNQTMGGTDRFDQMVTYYHTNVRSKAWPVRIYTQFLHAATVNAHILFKLSYPALTRKDPCFTLLSFLTRLCDELAPASNIILQAAPKKSHAEDEHFRRTGMHIPLQLKRKRDEAGQQPELRRKCAICKHRSTTTCQQCNVALCLEVRSDRAQQGDNCWSLYHFCSKN